MNRMRRKHSLFMSQLSDGQFTTHVVDCFAASSSTPLLSRPVRDCFRFYALVDKNRIESIVSRRSPDWNDMRHTTCLGALPTIFNFLCEMANKQTNQRARANRRKLWDHFCVVSAAECGRLSLKTAHVVSTLA